MKPAETSIGERHMNKFVGIAWVVAVLAATGDPLLAMLAGLVAWAVLKLVN